MFFFHTSMNNNDDGNESSMQTRQYHFHFWSENSNNKQKHDGLRFNVNAFQIISILSKKSFKCHYKDKMVHTNE